MKKLISICLVAVVAFSLSAAAFADGGGSNVNYMSLMISAATTGDYEAGQAAEAGRNSKIDAAGLHYAKISFEDLYLLSKIIYAEAGSEWLSDEWKMCVGEVVLNRVASPEFPDTIPEVIYQGGQYYSRNSGYFANLRPSGRCVLLALRLLEGERVMNDPSVVFQANFRQGSGVCLKFYDSALGATYFCYSNHPELYVSAASADEAVTDGQEAAAGTDEAAAGEQASPEAPRTDEEGGAAADEDIADEAVARSAA